MLKLKDMWPIAGFLYENPYEDYLSPSKINFEKK
jgi:hypothetical protein